MAFDVGLFGIQSIHIANLKILRVSYGGYWVGQLYLTYCRHTANHIKKLVNEFSCKKTWQKGLQIIPPSDGIIASLRLFLFPRGAKK